MEHMKGSLAFGKCCFGMRAQLRILSLNTRLLKCSIRKGMLELFLLRHPLLHFLRKCKNGCCRNILGCMILLHSLRQLKGSRSKGTLALLKCMNGLQSKFRSRMLFQNMLSLLKGSRRKGILP